MATMEALAEKAGGQVSLYRGGNRTGEVMHHQQPALQTIQKRLKHSFDPDALFNPGRLYSWL
jgi:glycolate oxidase FAD binding subunit